MDVGIFVADSALEFSEPLPQRHSPFYGRHWRVSDYANIVLEPPNVCKDGRQSSRAKWRAFYDTFSNRDCKAEGFIRVWPEHLSGGTLPSNPDHFMELQRRN